MPATRIARIGRLGGLAGGIVGRMLVGGMRQLASGQRPQLQDLLLTPANALIITQQLAQMRGAAMKVGQLMSMDAGAFLPPELSNILSRLRADAEPMPPQQLRTVLDADWGKGWIGRFADFNVRPFASASIGQVHRARTKDGRDLAIKVQYPGVRASIDSDVTNVAARMRLSGLIPKTLDLAPLLAEARRQLQDEADYACEAAQMTRCAELLRGAPQFQVPGWQGDFSGRNVLAMDFLESQPIEVLEAAPQAERDRVVQSLIRLALDELFTFNLMQTDANFANYRFNPKTGQIVLLDFGATRSFAPETAPLFRTLLQAGLAGDRGLIRQAAIQIGYFDATTKPAHQEAVLGMIDLAMTPFRSPGVFDFNGNDLVQRLRDQGLALGGDRAFCHILPMDVLLVHRKIGGLYLLASRLKARIDLHALLGEYAQ